MRDGKLVVNEAEAARVRRVFELFTETGSGVEAVRRLRDEGVAAKSGRSLNKGDVYQLLNNRTFLNGRQPPELGLPGLVEPLPAEWSDQGQALVNARPALRCVLDQRPAGGRCTQNR